MLQAGNDAYSLRTLDSFDRCEEGVNFDLQADSKSLLTDLEVV